MAWSQVVTDIPMNNWFVTPVIHAVSVCDQVYLFGCRSSGGAINIEVLAFNPKTYTWRVEQPHASDEHILIVDDTMDDIGTFIHFAVAFNEKVYMCVGVNETKVFDTRSARWSSVNTSGDIRFGRQRVPFCEVNGRVYMWQREPPERSYLCALDLGSLRWEVVGSWNDVKIPFHIDCLLPFHNRLYVLFNAWTTTDLRTVGFDLRHFDLETRQWEQTKTFDRAPHWYGSDKNWYLPFIHRGKLYSFFRQISEDRFYNSRPLSGIKTTYRSAINYSFATKESKEVRLKGAEPPVSLDSVCVVKNTAVFFSFNEEKAYVLDFSFPSLRRLCIETIREFDLEISLLPSLLQEELKNVWLIRTM